MSFASRLKSKREELGLKQSELGQLLGITGSAIGNYETGVSSPKADILYRVFDVLKCDANYLFQDEMKMLASPDRATSQEMAHIKKYRTLDEHGKEAVDAILDLEHQRCISASESIVSVNFKSREINLFSIPVSAGTGMFLDGEDSEKIRIPDTYENARVSFAVVVRGDSMSPQYKDGDCLLVSGGPTVDDGDVGVFVLNSESFVKVYRRHGNKVHLESLNPVYAPIIVKPDDQLTCCGKVIAVL